MNTRREVLGRLPDGREVAAFTLVNSAGYELQCMSYGATLIGFRAPDRDGSIQELTLGCDRLEGYVAGHPFFGSSVGRVCNRISGARFELDGKAFTLPANENGNTLHGGPGGFHLQLWDAEVFQSDERAGVVFHRLSPDGDSGFPGNLDVTIVMSLAESNELQFEYRAESDAPTPVNLTNHAYWNLAGAPDTTARETPAGRATAERPAGADREAAGGAIGDHIVLLNAGGLLEVDEQSIPTGRISPVGGSPYDFTAPRRLGDSLSELPEGIDHCYILGAQAPGQAATAGDAPPASRATGEAEIERTAEAVLAATVSEPVSGRRMDVLTSLPAIQFYTGNKLAGRKSRGPEPYRRHDAFCLESQLYVDAVNRPEFPSVILRPGDVFEHRTIHRFAVE